MYMIVVVIKAHLVYHTNSLKPEFFKIIITKHVKHLFSLLNVKCSLEGRVCINSGDAWAENVI